MIAPQDAPAPIRRSSLEPVHAALGARWVDESTRWPASYGDADAERAVLVERAGIADLGPIDKLMVRGPRTPTALRAIGIEPATGSVESDGGVTQAWCLADDEVLLLSPASAPTERAAGAGWVADRARAAGAAVTELGSGLSVLRLVGPASGSVLERACAVDLSPVAVPEGRIVQAPLAGVRVVLARQDHPSGLGYTNLVARDLAQYLWDALLDLGRDIGLTPVGGDAARAGSVGDGTAGT